MKKRYKQIFLLILIILECYLIWAFSNQNGESSANVSTKVVEKTINIFNFNLNEKQLFIYHKIIRKLAHFSAYFILAFTTYLYSNTFENLNNKKIFNIKIKYIVPIVFCLCYALTDEMHQLFVQGRSGRITDVLIDMCGATASILLIFLIKRSKKVENGR